ncbi:hypothetical protein [Dactylosporangium sp. CA-092794]|uniref:hypothetical protein n=1 Tax=Dactylosporangium sp. CA-092794 TaxID=3239929 RepID=UPI003D92AE1A
MLENVGYRQLTALWRTMGMWAAIRGGKHVWGEMTRTGFQTVEPERVRARPGARAGSGS